MSDELKPCPCCGSEAHFQIVGEENGEHFGGEYIECPQCLLTTNLRFSCGEDVKPLLAETWNRRTAQSMQGAQESVAATPSAQWRANGEADPHGNQYDCERAALAMGSLTDDELANAVFLNGDARPRLEDVIAGKAHMPIAYLTAAKERIRWLSRALERTVAARVAAEAELARTNDFLQRVEAQLISERERSGATLEFLQNDAYVIQYQTLGQYRTAAIAIHEHKAEP